MIVSWAKYNNLLAQLNHLEMFAEHVKPIMILYNSDDEAQITEEIKNRYSTLETPLIKSGTFLILQNGDFKKTDNGVPPEVEEVTDYSGYSVKPR